MLQASNMPKASIHSEYRKRRASNIC
jgi:hypothetical protein